MSPIQSLQNVVKSTNEKDLDEGAEFLAAHPEYADYTPEESRAVRNRIDWILLPPMILSTTLAAADKICISNAKLYGMGDVLVGNQYSWIGSIFYFGFLGSEPIANIIIQHYPVGWCYKIAYLYWNVMFVLMAAANNFGGLASLRFLMGIGEAVNFPVQATLISMFYTREEQHARLAITMSAFSSLITGVISYGVGHSNSSVATWKLLFVTFGCITFLVTIWLFLVIPNSPMSTWWLTEKQRYIAIDRTRKNRTGTRNTVLKRYQVVEALIDYKNWLMCIAVISWVVPAGGLVTFAAQIVSSMGYSTLKTTLLGMPTGVFQTFASFVVVVLSAFTPKKFKTVWSIAIGIIPLACGLVIKNVTVTASNKTGMLMAYYFFYFFWGPYIGITALAIANTSGNSKKTIVNAMNFTSYCIGNIIAPQFFRSQDAPGYALGYDAIIGFVCAGIVCLFLYGAGCIYENRLRDKKYGPPPADYHPDDDALDLTDKEKERYFRYSW